LPPFLEHWESGDSLDDLVDNDRLYIDMVGNDVHQLATFPFLARHSREIQQVFVVVADLAWKW
jgi:hypothetical protein